MSGWTIRALRHMSFRVSPNHGPRSDAEEEGERHLHPLAPPATPSRCPAGRAGVRLQRSCKVPVGITRSLNRKTALAAKAVSMWAAREIPLLPLARLEARSE